MGQSGVKPVRGIILAAPASSSGKTTVTLGLLRLLSQNGIPVQGAKCGPDYIDPTLQEAASGRASVNLDQWAMPVSGLRGLVVENCLGDGPARFLLVEGAMGVIDGAGPGREGSPARLAHALGLPVILVIDVRGQSDSSVLSVLGMKSAYPGTRIRGVILNRLGSERHGRIVGSAMARHGIRVFGGLQRDDRLELPSRHLGLVPAGEHPRIGEFLDHAAHAVESGIDVDGLLASASSASLAGGSVQPPVRPLGQRIAIARDVAFSFIYEHVLAGWRRGGAELSFFSPLDDQMPAEDADAVFLPGGYPELHAGKLADCGRFRRGMQRAVARQAAIYGECGGYMVLGQEIADGEGMRHRMLGLLPHSTSFRNPRLHLGYRFLRALDGAPLEGTLAGHEFHYSCGEGGHVGRHLFEAADADGVSLGRIGCQDGRVSGSFAHVICAADSHRSDLPSGW